MIVDHSKYDIYDEHVISQMACFAMNLLDPFGTHDNQVKSRHQECPHPLIPKDLRRGEWFDFFCLLKKPRLEQSHIAREFRKQSAHLPTLYAQYRANIASLPGSNMFSTAESTGTALAWHLGQNLGQFPASNICFSIVNHDPFLAPSLVQ